MSPDRTDPNPERSDRYENDEGDRSARVAYVLGRAKSLSEELKSTVDELAEMLHYVDNSGEEPKHSE